MASRLALPWMLATFLDRTLMIVSMLLIAVSAVALLVIGGLGGFVVAQGAQGLARGTFHTASQTHAVRGSGVPSRRLAFTHTTAQLGHLIGPALAGAVAVVSLEATLWLTVGIGIAFAGLGVTLAAWPPYARAPRSERRPIWRRADLGTAAWGGSLGGLWRGLSESYIPVILKSRGIGDTRIGLLLSLADAAGFATTAAVARWGGTDVRRFVPFVASILAGAVAAFPHASGTFAFAGLMMAGGSAGGVGGVLGTAVAHASVEETEQGAAISLVGTYRSASRLVTPAAVGGALSVLAYPAALAVVAVAAVLPWPWLVRIDRRIDAARRVGGT
jgi:hypothetical protein